MNFAERDGFIWFDGEYVPWAEAKVHVLTHTLHYGMGVFEGIRVYETNEGSAIFRLEEHLQRLFDSAKMLGMQITYSMDEIIDVSKNILKKNGLKAAYIRPMCFYGSEGMGLHAGHLKTHMIVAAWEWGAYLGEEGLAKGVRIQTSSFRRISANSLLGKAKANGHYINSMLALQEAQMAGYDEALMLDHQGYVAEGSGENIFVVAHNAVCTPPLGSILEGITRDTVITLCHDLNIPIQERIVTRDEIYVASEAFFTGTAAEVTPIRELDGRIIGNGKRGTITERIQKAFFNLVAGKTSEHSDWLTPV